MDKKNTIIGMLLLAASFMLLIWQGNQAQQQAQEQAAEENPPATSWSESEPSDTPAQAPGLSPDTATPAVTPATTPDGPSLIDTTRVVEIAQPAAPQVDEELFVLANSVIEVTFTNIGGGIKHVDFIQRGKDETLKYPATINSEVPYRFNTGASIPALAISLPDRANGNRPSEYAPTFELLSRDANLIRFYHDTADGIRIVRAYKLQLSGEGLDPYVIEHETKFVNRAEQPLPLTELYVNSGTAPPTDGDIWGEFLNFGYRANNDTDFVKLGDFDGSGGFLGIGQRAPKAFELQEFPAIDGTGPVEWVAVKNQFFASILAPQSARGTAIFTRPVELGEAALSKEKSRGVTGSMRFNLGDIPAGEERFLNLLFYVGPKEYLRIKELSDEAYGTVGTEFDDIMQFGFVSGISKLLLWALVSLHDLIAYVAPTWAWGFAIILLTVIIKGAMWPLTQVQVRSSKRMAELQKPMAEIREKYKDNPQKLNEEMMRMWREHKINPAAGCLPILVQIPIFIGLFYMLRTSSELRFAPFLWMDDLSVADTLFTIGGFPINLLPLLMGVTMYYQMKFTPSPTMDEMQRKIFQFMPFIFLIFCYQFPAGLVLYWTVQNLLTILQQWLTNRVKDEEDIKIETELAEAEQKKTRRAPTKKKRKKK